MNPVEIPCLCPGTPHATDTVTLHDPLPFGLAVTIRQTLGRVQEAARQRDGGMTGAEYQAVLAELYLFYGIREWTLVDADGNTIPITKANVTNYLMVDLEAASAVAEEADELYTKKVIFPLLQGASTSSDGSSTDGSTSATNGTGTTPPKPSRPSSTSISPMAGTVAMTT